MHRVIENNNNENISENKRESNEKVFSLKGGVGLPSRNVEPMRDYS
jgi:hypothetical protein